jgi:hypothetical protein
MSVKPEPRVGKVLRGHTVGGAAVMKHGEDMAAGDRVTDRIQKIGSPLPPAISESNAIIITINHPERP